MTPPEPQPEKPNDGLYRFQNLTADESLVYNVIHSTGRSGIWQREITTRTNLTATILSRCLKSLEGKNYIKKIRNVKQTGKIIYMLAELTPSEDVTGGAWFTDGVLDSNFIKILAYFIEFFVSRKSWYEVSTTTDPHKHRNKRQKISGSAAKLDLEKQYLPYPTLCIFTGSKTPLILVTLETSFTTYLQHFFVF